MLLKSYLISMRSNYELLFNKVLSEFKWIVILYFTPGTKLMKTPKKKLEVKSFDIIFTKSWSCNWKNIHDIENFDLYK